MLDKVNNASSNFNHDDDTQNVNSIALSSSQSAKPFFNKIGLRAKAVLFAVSISTLPVLVIGAVSHSFVSQSRRQDIETAHTNQAKQITTNLKNSLKEHLQEIQYLPNPDLLDNRRFVEQQQILKKWQDQNLANSNSQLYIIDLNGNVVTNYQNKFIENQKQEEYFETVLKTNKPFVSQPITDTANQDYIILAAPVKNASTGEKVYVIRNSIPVNYFHNIIKNTIKDTTQGNYYITDASGKIFLSNDKSNLGKNTRQFQEWAQIQNYNQNQNQTVTNIDARRNASEVKNKCTDI